MTANDEQVLEFGTRAVGVEYIVRPGAYAVVFDSSGRVAVMRNSSGYYLPGGGIEAGESEERALEREVLEECGCAVAIDRRLGVAIQYLVAAYEGAFAKRGTFFLARFTEQVCDPIEDDHELVWLTAAEARERLEHASQWWAVETALDAR